VAVVLLAAVLPRFVRGCRIRVLVLLLFACWARLAGLGVRAGRVFGAWFGARVFGAWFRNPGARWTRAC